MGGDAGFFLLPLIRHHCGNQGGLHYEPLSFVSKVIVLSLKLRSEFTRALFSGLIL